MKISIDGYVSLVKTERKAKKIKRKGYWRNGKYIKAGHYIKYVDVPLKKPYLTSNVRLVVDDELVLGRRYADDRGNVYVCTSVSNILCESICEQYHMVPNHGDVFIVPQHIKLVAQLYQES